MNDSTRRAFLVRTAAATAVYTGAARAYAFAQEAASINVAAIPSDISGSAYYAQDNGFFKKAGLDGGTDEHGTVAVLRHLLVEAEEPAQELVEATDALAALGELAADLRDAGDHLGTDAVHHHVGVALEQAHHTGHPLDDRLLRRGAEEVEQAALGLPRDQVGSARLLPIADAAQTTGGAAAGSPGPEVAAFDRAPA